MPCKERDIGTDALAVHRGERFIEIEKSVAVVADENCGHTLHQIVDVRLVGIDQKVFLRVRVRIDKTRHDGHATCIDDEIGRRIRSGIDRRNPIASDADVGIAWLGQRAVVYGAIDDQHGVTFGLRCLPR